MSLPRQKLRNFLRGPIRNGYSPVCVEGPTSKKILGLGALTDNGLDLRQTKWVPDSDEKSNSYILRPGDFLVSRSNTLDKVGRAALYRGGLENCSYPDLMMRFRIDESKLLPDYLEVVLQSTLARKHFMRAACGTSGSMVKITKQAVESLQIPVPAIEEQQAIADLLSIWDEAIEKTERLIQAKEKSFVWVREKLISSENENVAKGWKEYHLGDVSEVIKKTPIDSVEGKTLLTVKLHCRGVEANTRIKPKLTNSGRPYYIRNAGEFLIGRQNFHNGGFGIVPEELDGHIASNAITSLVTHPDRLSPEFLFYYFSRPNYYRRIGHIMDGTGQKELSEKQLLKLKLHLPNIVTQKKIVAALNLIRHEIILLEDIAGAYKKQKRGLMQKLLTGQWRVKMNKEVA